ncbi:phage tail protein [Catenuloplanes japonicus]|uniref:phage tail protein n=1 Tax=Catenuloplanes japonicus TaxID=33876 RepID=UPI00052705E1|nr:phage tail protein [Catenuloplanes japonicus]
MTDRPVYDLLPAVHRARDAELGHPLRALLAVVEGELLRLREDIDTLYDDAFVETCAPDMLPYLGELLGLGPETVTGRRALVADALAHRRAKGTPAALADVARAVTGSPVRAVEYFRLLVTTQHLRHPRPANVRTPRLRDPGLAAAIGTAFDTVPRTVDVRHADSGRGLHNIGSVGLHVWRLEAYPATGWDARAVDPDAGRWTFDPAGRDRPLFIRPPGIATGRTEADVPQRLTRLMLHRALTRPGPGGPEPAVEVRLGDRPATLVSADLSGWARPAAGLVAVDPHLGRFTVPPGETPDRIRVSFHYGAAGDLGAGPWDRRATRAEALAAAGTPWTDDPDWTVTVRRNGPGTTLAGALDAWNARTGPGTGVIVVADSATHPGPLPEIVLPHGARLLITAADGHRPHLATGLRVSAPAGNAADATALVLDGLSVEGDVHVADGDLEQLVLSSCTLAAVTTGPNPRLTAHLLHSSAGTVRLTDVPSLVLRKTALSSDLDAEPADVTMDECTVLGRTSARTLTVSGSILRGRADVVWRQQGYLRFSYAPLDSRVPRRYRCQPADAASARRIGPAFTSLDPREPGYCRLTAGCPAPIARGADDGGEMGVFHGRRHTGDLAAHLDEHLRFGLEAGIRYAD